MGRKYTGIEEVLDVNDMETWWYYIHEYPAYEVSNATSTHGHLVRSFKSAHKYPYGMLIKPKDRSNDLDPAYELTNLNNERCVVRLSQLIYMARNLPYAVAGYPRHTNMASINCRNQRIFINKKLKSPPLDNTTRFYPKFNIIEDEFSVLEKHPNYEPANTDISVPIEPIDGSNTYYGRKDCRTTFR